MLIKGYEVEVIHDPSNFEWVWYRCPLLSNLKYCSLLSIQELIDESNLKEYGK